MTKFLAQIAALDWMKVVGIGIALGVAFYFMLYDDGTKSNEAITAATARLKTAQTQLSQTEKALADANRFEIEVQIQARQFEKIIDFMPATTTANDLTTIINKQTQISGVRAANIKPKSEVNRVGFYETSKVDLELEGSFAQIVTFLSYMSRVPKLLTFENTAISQAKAGADNAASFLKFKSTLVGYKYIKDAPMPELDKSGQPVKLGPNGKPLPTPTPKPGTTPAPAPGVKKP